MGFSAKQVQALRRQPNRSHIRTREAHGRELTYLEGWYAISEANRIFGFDGWSRETIESRCVLARETRGSFLAVYLARVRLTVHADGTTIVREGHGTGEGRGASPGEVHDIALKAAETDATKRALATFGKPFGLELYRGGKATMRTEAPALAHRSRRPASRRRPRRLPSGRHHPYSAAIALLRPAAKQDDASISAASGEKSSTKPDSAAGAVRIRSDSRRRSTRASSPSPSRSGCVTRRI